MKAILVKEFSTQEMLTCMCYIPLSTESNAAGGVVGGGGI